MKPKLVWPGLIYEKIPLQQVKTNNMSTRFYPEELEYDKIMINMGILLREKLGLDLTNIHRLVSQRWVYRIRTHVHNKDDKEILSVEYTIEMDLLHKVVRFDGGDPIQLEDPNSLDIDNLAKLAMHTMVASQSLVLINSQRYEHPWNDFIVKTGPYSCKIRGSGSYELMAVKL